jgi:glycosyltransferase involved in cell wall biosynthesis
MAPYVARLWGVCARADVLHVMANSGWSWHCFAAPAVWVARARGVPVVVHYHGGLAESFLRKQARLVRVTLRGAHALVVPSGFLQTVFARFDVRAQIVPNGVDFSRFGGAMRPQPEPGHIVVTRNLEPIYGIATALKAFARVLEVRADARLTIAGSGPQRDALEAQMRQLGLAGRVCFTGALQPAEIARLYARAEVFLNPSFADNMPVSVLEALAAGVPVVSTGVGGVPWMVEHDRSALLVPAGDDQVMAQALLRVLDDGALRERLVTAGAQDLARYRWPSVCAQWLAVYQGLAGRRA